jgi:hypothetical protein
VITTDENDYFAGGPPSPANCDGVTIPCTYAKKGEVDIDLSQLMATEFGEGTPFGVHSDDAPTVYINGNPALFSPLTRRFEHEAAVLTAFNPITGNTDALTQAIADQQEQAFLHMVTADPNRTPNFIMFANPDYFLSASAIRRIACRFRLARTRSRGSPGTTAISIPRSPIPGSAWQVLELKRRA